ncbi:MAG: hypothetical protein LBQ22_11450 [Bacteroidales bacterium]|jgi:hypothetical protein|nr:hypothetical protein [Bacteroidales bacterium]
MNKILALILFVIISYNIFSQITIPTGTKQEINKFLKNITCVVLKNEFMSDYNDAIKAAISDHWTITPVEYIKESEFHKLRKDVSKSFLVINQVYFDKDKSSTLFDFLILTNGGNFKTVNDMPTICGVPLSYSKAPEEDYNYKLGLIVKFIQNHIELCISNPAINQDNAVDYYTGISGIPDDKIFYVLADELAPELRNQSLFSKNYPYNYKFSSKEEIAELIKNNDKNAVILHKISPYSDNNHGYCIKIIIDTENAIIYYYDMQKVNKNNPPFLLPDDLKNLSSKK